MTVTLYCTTVGYCFLTNQNIPSRQAMVRITSIDDKEEKVTYMRIDRDGTFTADNTSTYLYNALSVRTPIPITEVEWAEIVDWSCKIDQGLL